MISHAHTIKDTAKPRNRPVPPSKDHRPTYIPHKHYTFTVAQYTMYDTTGVGRHPEGQEERIVYAGPHNQI